MFDIQEIDKRTFNPNVYFSSSNYARNSKRVNKNANVGSRANKKRVNYSLADMEMQIYNRANADDDNTENTDTAANAEIPHHQPKAQIQATEKQILSSQKRFLELDTENPSDTKFVPQLLSSLTGVNKDKLMDASASLNQQRVTKRFEKPKNVKILYKSTKPPENLLKKNLINNNRSQTTNKNRATLIKKILTSKRSLSSYIEALDRLNFKIIFNNVYNKRFFKILRLMNICSMCGNSTNLSQCIKCHGKICNSMNCYTLHKETRCDT